eukprot:2317821-Pyramimonas_sp.AAC.1
MPPPKDPKARTNQPKGEMTFSSTPNLGISFDAETTWAINNFLVLHQLAARFKPNPSYKADPADEVVAAVETEHAAGQDDGLYN